MPFNLATVQEFADGIRGLLQDLYQPYRYPDAAILQGLNLAFLEGMRVRPDLFIAGYGINVPQFTTVDTTAITIEPQFKTAFMYGATAQILRRDEEDVQDARSNTMSAIFHNLLIGERPGAVQGGTPPAQTNQNGQGGG